MFLERFHFRWLLRWFCDDRGWIMIDVVDVRHSQQGMWVLNTRPELTSADPDQAIHIWWLKLTEWRNVFGCFIFRWCREPYVFIASNVPTSTDGHGASSTDSRVFQFLSRLSSTSASFDVFQCCLWVLDVVIWYDVMWWCKSKCRLYVYLLIAFLSILVGHRYLIQTVKNRTVWHVVTV